VTLRARKSALRSPFFETCVNSRRPYSIERVKHDRYFDGSLPQRFSGALPNAPHLRPNRLALTDPIDFALERERRNGLKRKTKEEVDSPVQQEKGIFESALDSTPACYRWIRDSPMRGHRLSKRGRPPSPRCHRL